MLEFRSWSFFGAFGSLALILTVLSVALATVRRLTYGKGLADYLTAQQIPEDPGRDVSEKDARQLGEQGALPTFSARFPSRVPPAAGLMPPPPPLRAGVQGAAGRVWSWMRGDDRV